VPGRDATATARWTPALKAIEIAGARAAPSCCSTRSTPSPAAAQSRRARSTVRLQHGRPGRQRRRAPTPDIVVASAKAYLTALNKLHSKAERVAAQGLTLPPNLGFFRTAACAQRFTIDLAHRSAASPTTPPPDAARGVAIGCAQEFAHWPAEARAVERGAASRCSGAQGAASGCSGPDRAPGSARQPSRARPRPAARQGARGARPRARCGPGARGCRPPTTRWTWKSSVAPGHRRRTDKVLFGENPRPCCHRLDHQAHDGARDRRVRPEPGRPARHCQTMSTPAAPATPGCAPAPCSPAARCCTWR
jgi:hypothetical protein